MKNKNPFLHFCYRLFQEETLYYLIQQQLIQATLLPIQSVVLNMTGLKLSSWVLMDPYTSIQLSLLLQQSELYSLQYLYGVLSNAVEKEARRAKQATIMQLKDLLSRNRLLMILPEVKISVSKLKVLPNINLQMMYHFRTLGGVEKPSMAILRFQEQCKASIIPEEGQLSKSINHLIQKLNNEKMTTTRTLFFRVTSRRTSKQQKPWSINISAELLFLSTLTPLLTIIHISITDY